MKGLFPSTDPEQDDVVQLQAFAAEMGVDPDIWRLATGDAAQLRRVKYEQ
ncbi:MAG: hypothetical protein GY805_07000 [Chloroflexi bacterium]|nr:hypothetical protein [Chloroflexota bacterium]